MRGFRFALVAFAILFVPSTQQAFAASNPDAKACDSSDPAVRIAGCTRLINSGRVPKRLLADVYYQRGQGYSLAGRNDEAIADFSRSLAERPTLAAYSDRGVAYLIKGDFAQAHRDFDKSIELDPKNYSSYFNKAFAYAGANDHDNAIRFHDKSLAIKKTAQGLNGRGVSWRSKGDSVRALADFDEAIRVDATFPNSYINLSGLYADRGEFERSLVYCDQAIRLLPNSAESYHNRALILYHKGDYDSALIDLEKAVALDPNGAVVFLLRGQIFSAKGDYDRAIADFDRGLKFGSESFVAYVNRGSAWQRKGDLDKALADFNRVVVSEPNNPAGYSARATVYVAQGKFEQAFADFDTAIKLDPLSLAAFADRGEAYEKFGKIEQARDDFKKALELPRVRFLGIRGGLGVSQDARREQEAAKARLAVLDGAANLAPLARPAVATATSPKAETPGVGRKIALVIGNGAYRNAPPLPNPPNDARGVASNLRNMGFEVSEGIDLDKAKLRDGIVAFLRDAASANLVVVFYAGHGMQIDGKNYLVPVDANFDGSSDFTTVMTDVDTILAALDGKLRTNIIILDACRDNPMAKPPVVAAAEPSRSVRVRSGLAAPSNVGAGAMAGAGTMIAFATAPGQVALDGDGANSPFSAALIRHVGTPGLEVQQMMTRVRADVVASTKSKQVPWSNSALIGEVFLNAK